MSVFTRSTISPEVLAVDHRLELLANRLLVLVPVRARFRRVLQLREGLPEHEQVYAPLSSISWRACS